MGGDPMSRLLILTDSRYLAQRMPAALVEALNRTGARQTSVICADQLVDEIGGAASRTPGDADVVVVRSRNLFALSLLYRWELAGLRACNCWDAITAVRDKARAAVRLAERGIPTPRTFLADSPAALRDVDRGAWPLLLKPPMGDNGQGIRRVDAPADLARLRWPDGMVVAQQYVDVAGVDLKLYGCGDEVWAVRRPSPLRVAPAWCEPVRLTSDLRDLAYACRDAFGLELYGIDVLASPGGPLVVDVNDFPNYTGVPQAAEVIATWVSGLRVKVSA